MGIVGFDLVGCGAAHQIVGVRPRLLLGVTQHTDD
jgi:hypothetical protein